MTDLTKTVRRRLPRERHSVLLAPDGLYMRQAGHRKLFGPLGYETLLRLCADVSNRDAKRQKDAARKLAKLARGGR